MNAQHAREQTDVTKADALELLHRNSREAVAVRAFRDDELDQAAPFFLSFGAPVTAQFVIEDHPLSDSWGQYFTDTHFPNPMSERPSVNAISIMQLIIRRATPEKRFGNLSGSPFGRGWAVTLEYAP